jgi:prepilin-type N-terminal cleavage/methylation domain-containing protein
MFYRSSSSDPGIADLPKQVSAQKTGCFRRLRIGPEETDNNRGLSVPEVVAMEKVRNRKRQSRRISGFTMVEMMIVVLVLAMLVEMAIPQFITARHRARQRTCMSNLRQMEVAKEQLAINKKLQDGDAMAMADIVPDYIRNVPACPSGGAYTLQVCGTSPECSMSVGNYAHTAP